MNNQITCSGCGLSKDIEAFNKSSQNRYPNRFYRRHNCKSCEHLYRNKIEQGLRNEIFLLLGNKCSKCGFKDKRALQIDHVNGGGNKEHKQIKNPIKFYHKVLSDNTGMYQILCANCNWIKRHEQKEEAFAPIR